jgi:ADP-ribosylglycohydrolase
MKTLDRYLGCMLGLAAGDAVGTTAEFAPRGTFPPVMDMTGGGPFGLEAGQWTDDTSMALCLAASLAEQGGFDARDQMTRYCRWWKDGYMSSTGRCFDIGITTRGSLARFQASGDSFAGPVDENSAGNGSLMRLAPVPLFFSNRLEEAITYAGQSSQTTHGAPAAVDACRYFAGLIVGALRGESKEIILSPLYCPISGYWERNPLHPEVHRIALGSFKGRPAAEIRASGFVIHTLEAALWAFHSSGSFEEGCLKAVNLGEDADTTGAVFGQLAGAFYGRGAIPAQWVSKLALRETIEGLAETLCRIAGHQVVKVRDRDSVNGLQPVRRKYPAHSGTRMLQVVLHTGGRVKLAHDGHFLGAGRSRQDGLAYGAMTLIQPSGEDVEGRSVGAGPGTVGATANKSASRASSRSRADTNAVFPRAASFRRAPATAAGKVSASLSVSRRLPLDLSKMHTRTQNKPPDATPRRHQGTEETT